MLTPLLIATAVLAQPTPEVWDPPNSAVLQVPAAPPAKAGLAAPAEPEDPNQVSKWYGGASLLADAVALTATTALFYKGHEVLALVPLTAFVFTGPVNHSAHGHQSRTLVSLGLRGAVTATGVVVLVARMIEWKQDNCLWDILVPYEPCDYNDSVGPKVLLGALIGTSLLDNLLMAWARVPRPSAPGAGVYVTPVVQMAGGGAGLSLGGRF